MAYGANVFDTSNQLMFSTSKKVFVFGGSSVDTNTSNPDRVTKGGTVCQPFMVYSDNQGGFIDFRIEDTTLLPNTTDAALQLALVPFFSGPRPIGSAMVYKANRSGCTNTFYNNDGFVSNAGTGVSSIVIRTDGPTAFGTIFTSSGYAPTSTNLPSASEMQRARPAPQLIVGDVFQFTPGGGTAQTYGYEWGQTTYQGTGTQYTVQSITRSTTNTNTYTVTFSPQKASAPPQYSKMAVSDNLNKVFVRAFIQNTGNPSDNLSNVGPLQGDWNMYYFREIKNSDAQAGMGRYGINVFDASGDLTYTSNRRAFEIAAMGTTNAISFITANNTSSPLAGSSTTTGLFTTSNKNWDFGTTPTNYAVYAPIAGACQSSPSQSNTPGTGLLTQGNTAGVSQGVECGVTLWPSSTTQFCPAKVGPPNWGATIAVTTNNYVFPCSLVAPQGSYIMVINTDKYQP